MPLFFNNIRSANNSNLFIFNFTYNLFNNISIGLTIPESNYVSISSLLSALNNQINISLALYSGVNISLTLTNIIY